MKKSKYVCPFLVLVILFGCRPIQPLERNSSAHQEIGKSVHDLKYEQNYIVHITYPKTMISDLDENIKDFIDAYQSKYIERVKTYDGQEKAELHIDYQSYVKDERYLSIKLDVFERIDDVKEEVVTWCYDKEKQMFVSIEDIFHKDALEMISDHTREYFQSTFPEECETKNFSIFSAPTLSNYHTFVLRKDAIVFYFQAGTLFDRSVSFEMKYENLEDFSDMEEENISVFVPYDDILNEPVKYIDPNKAMIALTFDDGPTKKYTTAILDALKENHASATFFVLGSRADAFPELLQRMVLEGNEIGNHTFSHKQLTTLSKQRIEEEIVHAQESIHDVTNIYPNMIRPPYGSKNDTVLSCAQGKKFVTWSIDSEDWRSRNSETIVKKVLEDVKDGDIILMHDLYETTAVAAMILISELQDRGFQLVTVSELYAYGKNVAGKIF